MHGRTAQQESGSHVDCRNPKGIFDMNGNLEEWVLDDWRGLKATWPVEPGIPTGNMPTAAYDIPENQITDWTTNVRPTPQVYDVVGQME